MPESTSISKELLKHILKSSLRTTILYLSILLVLIIGLYLIYSRLQEELSVNAVLSTLLSSPSTPDSPLDHIVINFAEGLREIVINQLWSIGVIVVISLASLFATFVFVDFVLSLLSWRILIPRRKWVWDYFQREDTRERSLVKPLIVLSIVIISGFLLWGASDIFNVDTDYSVKHTNTILSSTAIILALFGVGVDYWSQIKGGLFRFYSSINPTPSKLQLLRFRLAKHASILIVILCLILGLLALQHMVLPRVIKNVEMNFAEANALLDSFTTEAKAAGISESSLDSIINNYDHSVHDFYIYLSEEFPQEVHDGIADIIPALVIAVLIILIMNVFMPLIYDSVRFPVFAVACYLTSLIGISIGIQWSLPNLLGLGGYGSIVLVIAGVGFSMIYGAVSWEIIRIIFHRTPIKENVYFIGNESNKKLHRSKCLYALRTSKKNVREFASIEEAEIENYERCRYCLNDI